MWLRLRGEGRRNQGMWNSGAGAEVGAGKCGKVAAGHSCCGTMKASRAGWAAENSGRGKCPPATAAAGRRGLVVDSSQARSYCRCLQQIQE